MDATPTPADQLGWIGLGHLWKSVCVWMAAAKATATPGANGIKVIESGEVPVNDWLVEQGPQPPGRL